MRRKLILFFIALAIALYVSISHLVAFIHLFFEHQGIAITQAEILAAHEGDLTHSRPQLIPKIIHHVYHDWSHNKSIPDDWAENRRNCAELNPGWKHMLWDEPGSRKFISTNYKWFLKTYDNYPFPIQKIDTVRYFLLRHYGGIYLDMDNGCMTKLDPVLYYPSWTTDGGRGALSNNILAASPQHPFWISMTNSLQQYNYNYFFPYITISYASGQWYHTAIWEAYHKSLRKLANGERQGALYRIMMDDRPGTDPWIFFAQQRGGTWKNWDNVMFLWIGDHLVLLALGITFLVVFAIWLILRCIKACGGRGQPRGGRYELLQRDV